MIPTLQIGDWVSDTYSACLEGRFRRMILQPGALYSLRLTSLSVPLQPPPPNISCFETLSNKVPSIARLLVAQFAAYIATGYTWQCHLCGKVHHNILLYIAADHKRVVVVTSAHAQSISVQTNSVCCSVDRNAVQTGYFSAIQCNEIVKSTPVQ